MLNSLARPANGVSRFFANVHAADPTRAIRAVVDLMGSANFSPVSVLEFQRMTGRAQIGIAEFWRTMLFGNWSHFTPGRSAAINIYDITSRDEREHFLLLVLLSWLRLCASEIPEHIAGIQEALAEMQMWGFTVSQTEIGIRRAVAFRLIEVANPNYRNLSDQKNLDAGKIRLTTVGAYYVNNLIPDFSYFDAMSTDTPILDINIEKEIIDEIESTALECKLKRADALRKYLTETWARMQLTIPYFSWGEVMEGANASFERISRIVESRRKSREP